VSLGGNIARARSGAGISQRELARRVGVSSPTMTNWERGQHEPPAGKLLAIAQACNVSVLFLYGLTDGEGLYRQGYEAGWSDCALAVAGAVARPGLSYEQINRLARCGARG